MDLRNLVYAGMIVIGIIVALFFGLRVDKTSDVEQGVDFYKALEINEEEREVVLGDAVEGITPTDKEEKEDVVVQTKEKIETSQEIKNYDDKAKQEKTKKIKEERSIKLKNSEVKKRIHQAIELSSGGDVLSARNLLLKTIGDKSIPASYPQLYKLLGDLNIRLLFSKETVQNETKFYTVSSGDTLSDIAISHKTTVALLKNTNNLTSSMIYIGQKIKVPQGTFSLLISKRMNTLSLLFNGTFFKFYYVGTGKNDSTPVGDFIIKNKQKDPVWFTNGKIIPYGDPENLLGTRWMGFDLKGYGIHGTWDDNSIGQQTSEGCIRLSNKEVEQLYDLLPLNTKITVVD